MLRSAWTVHLSCVKRALSRNGLKWASTWASQPRSAIGCIQNDFWACNTFGANCASTLHRHKHCLQMDENDIRHVPGQEFNPVRLKWFPCLWTFQPKPCTYLGSRLAPSPNGLKWASIWALNLGVPSGASKNDLCAYGTFVTNRAPILHRH
jgi:hypothetical protein